MTPLYYISNDPDKISGSLPNIPVILDLFNKIFPINFNSQKALITYTYTDTLIFFKAQKIKKIKYSNTVCTLLLKTSEASIFYRKLKKIKDFSNFGLLYIDFYLDEIIPYSLIEDILINIKKLSNFNLKIGVTKNINSKAIDRFYLGVYNILKKYDEFIDHQDKIYRDPNLFPVCPYNRIDKICEYLVEGKCDKRDCSDGDVHNQEYNYNNFYKFFLKENNARK